MIPRIVSGVYYTFTGLWFGAMVMLAVSAAVTFKTVRAQMPGADIMAQNLFAGNIVGNLIEALAVVQGICAAVVLICVALQTTVLSPHVTRGAANTVRMVLLLIALLLLVVDRAYVNPSLWAHRTVMFNEQADPQARKAAKAGFDRYHKRAEQIGGATTFLLAGVLLISPLALHRDPRSETLIHDTKDR